MKKPIFAVASLALIAGLVQFIALGEVAKPNPNQTNTGTSAQPQSAQIQITDQGLLPATLSIQAGTVVTWVNQTSKSQKLTTTESPGNENIDSVVDPGTQFNYTVTRPGSLKYQTSGGAAGELQISF